MDSIQLSMDVLAETSADKLQNKIHSLLKTCGSESIHLKKARVTRLITDSFIEFASKACSEQKRECAEAAKRATTGDVERYILNCRSVVEEELPF